MLLGGRKRSKAKPHRDREHQQRQQRAQLLAAQLLPGPHAVLRADHAGDHQDEGQHDVDGLFVGAWTIVV